MFSLSQVAGADEVAKLMWAASIFNLPDNAGPTTTKTVTWIHAVAQISLCTHRRSPSSIRNIHVLVAIVPTRTQLSSAPLCTHCNCLSCNQTYIISKSPSYSTNTLPQSSIPCMHYTAHRLTSKHLKTGPEAWERGCMGNGLWGILLLFVEEKERGGFVIGFPSARGAEW